MLESAQLLWPAHEKSGNEEVVHLREEYRLSLLKDQTRRRSKTTSQTAKRRKRRKKTHEIVSQLHSLDLGLIDVETDSELLFDAQLRSTSIIPFHQISSR